MKNSTAIKVPKKYEHMIEEIYHDQDGYWVYLADGFYSPESGCHTIHEMTQKDTLKQIRAIKEEVYHIREVDGMYYEVDLTFEQARERFKTLRIADGQRMYSRSTGDDVRNIWNSENTARNTGILLDEAIEQVERLERALSEYQETGCGGHEYMLQGEEREEVMKELIEAERLVEELTDKLETESIERTIGKIVDQAQRLAKSDGIKITHNPYLGDLSVEFPELGEHYFFTGDDYETLHKEYEESNLYEHLHFEEYVAYVSQSW